MNKATCQSIRVFSASWILTCVLLAGSVQVMAQEDAAELAKELANPIASLISVPLQNNMDLGIGSLEGSRNTLNIQPVIPLSITDDLNLITRVIIPVIRQSNITGEGDVQSGVADLVVSGFISPKKTINGFTWGAGPVLLVPSGHDMLSSKKFGIGPTAVFLRQASGFTYGALVNQIWSVAGDSERGDVNQMFFQPFLIYNWPTGSGVGMNFELTQNWEGNNTTLWWNPFINGITSIGKQKIQLGIGPRLNLAAPEGGKADWGVRSTIVFLFPK